MPAPIGSLDLPTLADAQAFWYAAILPRLHELADPYLGGYSPVLDTPQVPVMVTALALVPVVMLLFQVPSAGTAREREKSAEPKKLPALGPPGPIDQVLHRPEIPVRVGGVVFDRAWRHVGIVATSGARKSTLLAMLAEQLGVPLVVITGDQAPPLVNWTYSVGGWVWMARGGVPWYPWAGPLELACQRVEFMFPASGGDVGVHRSMFKQAARKAWSAADARHETRTLGQVLDVLPEVAKGQSSQSMVENWTARLRELEQSLGTSLGGELDVVEALRAGISVMFALNAFQDTSNRQRFAQIAILEAMRAADSLGNIGVAIDEVGLVGGELFGDAVRTFRVRRVTGLFASQIAHDFPDEVRGNVNVWFLGQQSGGDRQSRQWSSDCTFGLVPPEHFGEHVLPQGRFYLVAGGRVQDVRVPTWENRMTLPPRDLPAAKQTDGTPGTPGTLPDKDRDASPGRPSVQEPVEASTAAVERPPIPAYLDNPDGRRVWDHARFGDPEYPECWISTYAPNSSGYAKFSVFVPAKGKTMDGQLVHRWVYERAQGPIPPGYTLGHLCPNFSRKRDGSYDKRCFRPDHQRPELESVGTAERWERWESERSRPRVRVVKGGRD